MKTTLLAFLLCAAPLIATAEEDSFSPLKAIKQFGGISITDGSSFFTFSKDGSFRSGPLGISGREFEGHWTADGPRLVVTAKLGWINGVSTGHDYRRIVFVIYSVRRRPPENKPSLGGAQPELFDCYFLIDELVSIPEPTSTPK